MQVEDLARTYQLKSDEELLQLAADLEHLTPEARFTLQSELSRRELRPLEARSPTLQEEGDIDHAHDAHGEDVAEDLLPKANRNASLPSPAVGEFLAEVIRVYHRQFWLFVRLAIPAVVIGGAVIILARNEGREIARHLPIGYDPLQYRSTALQIWFMNMAACLTSWMLFSLSFGAICRAVASLETGDVPSPGDCFAAVGHRYGRFVTLSLLLLFFLLVLVGAAAVLSFGAIWTLHAFHFSINRWAILLVVYPAVSIGLLIGSRLALAMPAIVLDDLKVWEAIFLSDKLTEGRWLTLGALLTKSVIGSYVAGMLPFWLAGRIIPANFPFSYWVFIAASFLGVTLVEPPMFIGFALMYLRATSPRSSMAAVPA